MEAKRTLISASAGDTGELSKESSKEGNSNCNMNITSDDERIKTWKKLAQNQKELEKNLNQVIEAAIDIQCGFAVLITKTATLFDPNIIEIISGGTQGKPKEGDNRMEIDGQELEKNWEQKLEEFEKIKRTESQLNSKGDVECSSHGEPHGRGIGEPCTCDNDCDFSKWLTCQNNVCSCLKQKTFVYDYNQDTCVVRLGEKCFEITQEYSEYNIVDLPPIVRCIDGAFCSMSSGGTCSCNSYGYYESFDGSACLPKKNYAESCTRGTECLSEICSGVDGQCICKIGEFYHKKRKKCVGLIGAVCFGDDDCANNMICRDYDARCDCRPGYSETLFKTCEIKLSYGETCNLTLPCNNLQLSCIDSKCDCKYFDHQIYSGSTGSCKSLVGGPCQADDDCVEFSECKAIGLFSECQCQENYLEMQNGHCMKFNRYGFPCERTSECDPIPPLVCKESKCDCRDSLKVFDSERRICVGLAGAKCSPPSSIDHNPCTENAICVQTNLQLPGKCSCTSGSRVSSDRSCVLE